MDSEGYVPIAFVCNFQNIACFGASFEDIISLIQASSIFDLDLDNETFRLKDWKKVYLQVIFRCDS